MSLRAAWYGPLSVVVSALMLGPATGRAVASSSVKSTSLIREDADCRSTKPRNRADSLVAIASVLGLGEGSQVADIGAGNGRDTWGFAGIVGDTGTVYAEEITADKVESLEKDSQANGCHQVRPVLGRTDDPCLPADSIDLAFMNHVYHHLAKPREMLRGVWRALKPGGHLVVVDQRRGTLRDWVPRHLREKKHFWIAETTVVREAREEGFAFVSCAEDCWHAKNDFVLVFRRPEGLRSPGCDPDPFLPLPVRKCSELLRPLRNDYQRPVFVALGEGRRLIGPIRRRCRDQAVDIILEEWAIQKEERPPFPRKPTFPSVLTENGDPNLASDPIDVVFFLDSYHLLFHAKTLLTVLHDRLLPTGCVYVLDRQTDRPLSRREASHHRMISRETVEQEMAAAGFHLWCRGPQPASDRFLLVFGKKAPEDILPESDPLFSGPETTQKPGRWLKTNYWRTRGVKTIGGTYVPFRAQNRRAATEIVTRLLPDGVLCELVEEGVTLHFEKRETGYALTDCRSSEPAR